MNGEGDAEATQAAQLITVSTDVFDLVISTVGGTIQGAELLNYPIHKDEPDLVRLLDTSGKTFGLIESGVRAGRAGSETSVAPGGIQPKCMLSPPPPSCMMPTKART